MHIRHSRGVRILSKLAHVRAHHLLFTGAAIFALFGDGRAAVLILLVGIGGWFGKTWFPNTAWGKYFTKTVVPIEAVGELYALSLNLDLLPQGGHLDVTPTIVRYHYDASPSELIRVFSAVAEVEGWKLLKKRDFNIPWLVSGKPVELLAYATRVSNTQGDLEIVLLSECQEGSAFEDAHVVINPDPRHVHAWYFSDDDSGNVAALLFTFENALWAERPA